jgi:membrane protein implicated in regulation of membrane protease activity
MEFFDLVAQYGPWSWIVAGLVLLTLELAVPGGVFLWLGISAVATGLLTLRYPLALALQFGVFGVLGVLTVLVWLKLLRHPKERSDPETGRYLNERAARYVGHEAVLDEPIVSGFGRLPLGDSTWRIAGPDLPAGRRVRVVGHEGPVLKVEPA